MAELTKPQYHQTKTYPTKREIYSVRPGATRPLAPSQVPNSFETVSNVMDSLIGSLNQYQTIYENSEKTANVLQAKSLLLEKAKDTQRIRELLATELPNTGYQHLKLKDVLDKYRTKDADGKSGLYLGNELQHNITGMEMPDDLSEEVRSMVEDQWISDETAIVSDLIGQVTQLQGKQTLAVYNQHEAKYKRDLMNVYRNADNRYEGQQLAKQLRLQFFKEIEELGHLGTWNEQTVIAKKLNVGQLMLEQEFLAEYFKKSDNPIEHRETILRLAVNGQFSYEDESGEKISLDRVYYENLVFKDSERVHNQTVEDNEFKIVDAQQTQLLELFNKHKDKLTPYNELYQIIGDEEQYGEIPFSTRIKALIDYQIRETTNYEARQKTQESETKTANLEDLKDLLPKVGLELAENYDDNISKYATKNVDGKWRADEKKLKKISTNPEFKAEYINNIILAKTRSEVSTKEALEKKYKLQIDKAKQGEFVRKLINQADAGLGGPADILLNFAKARKLKNGTIVWEVDPAKLANNTAGGRMLLAAGIGGDDPNRSAKDIIAIRSAVMTDVIGHAQNRYNKYQAETIGQQVKNEDMPGYFDQIASIYEKNLESYLLDGYGGFQNTLPTFTDKKFTPEQFLELEAFNRHMQALNTVAFSKNRYTLRQLENHKKNLLAGNINGVPVNNKFQVQHLRFTKSINNQFDKRIKQLKESPQETGFLETGQEEYFAKFGEYDLDAYGQWLGERGIFEINKLNVVPRDILNKNNDITNRDIFEMPKLAAEHVNSLIPLLDKYGTTGSDQRTIALNQIRNSFPFGWQRILDIIERGELVPARMVQKKWLDANKNN